MRISDWSSDVCSSDLQERVEKRQEPLPLEGEDWLIGCPALAEQVIVPVDADGNDRFELLRVLIPPYEAGPNVEGTYEVGVPVTDAVRGLRSEGRGVGKGGVRQCRSRWSPCT